MTEPAVSPLALTFRSCFQAACQVFALPPSHQQPDTRRAALAPALTAGCTAPTSAWSQMGRGCSGPDADALPAAAAIEPQDWDLLFQAVLETVVRLTTEQPTKDAAAMRLQEPGDVLCECVGALDQLRRSVPQVQPQLPGAATGGARAGRGDASA